MFIKTSNGEMTEQQAEWPKLHLPTHQRDLGDSIQLFAGEPGAHIAVGVIYNWDDFLCLEEEQCEDADQTAIATAEKIIKSYNSHDVLIGAAQAALDWINLFAEHHPTCFGGEAALAAQLEAAIKKAQGE